MAASKYIGYLQSPHLNQKALSQGKRAEKHLHSAQLLSNAEMLLVPIFAANLLISYPLVLGILRALELPV